ncbi:MAG: peptide chain release factor N(5)-glutamine methyltransferase [Opitutales bacterium]
MSELLSIREIQQRTTAYFEQKGVPNAKLDADLLIAHALGIQRLELYLDLQRPLTAAQLDGLRPLVQRRAGREPLQYIIGSVDFAGVSLKVDARALIPRPETEELFERVCERCQSAPQRILDLGTGSGALAIALAQAYPEASVTAVDRSADALALARENAAAAAASIQFVEGSWYSALAAGETFDWIVSNPPYLTTAEMTTAAPEVLAHEPHSALVAGTDGLQDLRTIIAEAPQRLRPGGLLALETGIDQQAELEALVRAAGMTGECVEDLSGRPRFYFAHHGLSEA